MRNSKLLTKIIASPYASPLAQHPMFVSETRHARWAWSPTDFHRRSRRVVLLTHVVIIGVWLVLTALFYADIIGRGTFSTNSLQVLYNAGGNALVVLFSLAWLAGSEIDFGSIQASLDSISGEVAARRWDLLRLTSLNERSIVNAKHTIAQARMWRATIRQMSMRIALLVMILFHVLVLPLLFFDANNFWNGFGNDPLGTLGGLLIGILTGLVFSIEPLWRVKAMTALGIVISSYIENSALATLASLAVVFGMWLLQGLIFFVLALGSAFLSTTVFFTVYYTNSNLLLILYLLIVGLIATLTIYGFYNLLQMWSLRRVTQRILKGN